jgi:hypothetical protein
MARILGALVVLGLLLVAVLYWIGAGGPGDRWENGVPVAQPLAQESLDARNDAVAVAASEIGVRRAKQILFGDLHVHTTFSPDAFAMSLPMSGGDGARPISDACDYARFCASVDFWSINDHAVGIDPWKWEQTVQGIRQCDAAAGGSDDVTAFLGWEWTQMGTTPENHYGHKNVVLRGLGDEDVPDRPIAATSPQALADGRPGRVLSGLLGVVQPRQEIFDLLTFNDDLSQQFDCPSDVPVREQEPGCRDSVVTPTELYTRLDDWGFDSIVIPHGTAWGMYTPLGSAWDKQLEGAMHDPARQTLIEVFSGHGNSEEYRDWKEIVVNDDGSVGCAEPTADYLPSCWRAGEIIIERCTAEGADAGECEERAAAARQNYVEAGVPGHLTVQGTQPEDWLDSGQCLDCFQPSFNYRPKSSVQYIMAIRDFEDPENPRRFDFGFMASSDNHSARPGTGYKEYGRLDMTEARLGVIGGAIDVGNTVPTEKLAESVPYDPANFVGQFFATREAERAGSFFMTGGLIAVHAEGRGRGPIWDAMQRKEVYGTSGPRILLWFDLINPPGSRGGALAMGGETALSTAPIFQVRAAGSFEQKPGCPAESEAALTPERLARVCGGECYHPSDVRRPITRIEVVRVRPQEFEGEPVAPLIQDPWQVFACDGDPAGCAVTFTDSDFERDGRDTLYYARAIEAPSPAVGQDPLGCTRDENGRCTALDPCKDRPDDDDCLAPAEERAWSSPIFIEYSKPAAALELGAR